MKTRHAATLSLCAALALPFAASASNVWHQTDTEIGYAIAPEHATGGKSRAQVDSELAAAKADPGKWFLAYRNLGTPGWYKQGTALTRDEVQAEVRNMSARARPPEQHLHPGLRAASPVPCQSARPPKAAAAGGAAYAVPPFSAEFALPRIPARRIRARSASDRMAGSFPAGTA